MADSDCTQTSIRHRNFVEMTGKVFGRWTVVDFHSCQANGLTRWNCVCTCGTTKDVCGAQLRRGVSKSCGCLRLEQLRERNRSHGQANRGNTTPEFTSFRSILARCNNPKNIGYANYGGRGIECRFASFQEFFLHVGPKPTRSHSIDRINSDGHYEHGNVRWATVKQQQTNKRNTIRVMHNGVQTGLTNVIPLGSREYDQVLYLIRMGNTPTNALNQVLSKQQHLF